MATRYLVMPTFRIATALPKDKLYSAKAKYCSGKRRWLNAHFEDYLFDQVDQKHGLFVYEVSAAVKAKFNTMSQFADFLSEIIAPATFCNVTFFDNYDGAFGFLVVEGQSRAVSFKPTIDGELQESFLQRLFKKSKSGVSLESLADDEVSKAPARKEAAVTPAVEKPAKVMAAVTASQTTEKPAAVARQAIKEAATLVEETTDVQAAKSVARKAKTETGNNAQMSFLDILTAVA